MNLRCRFHILFSVMFWTIYKFPGIFCCLHELFSTNIHFLCSFKYLDKTNLLLTSIVIQLKSLRITTNKILSNSSLILSTAKLSASRRFFNVRLQSTQSVIRILSDRMFCSFTQNVQEVYNFCSDADFCGKGVNSMRNICSLNAKMIQ